MSAYGKLRLVLVSGRDRNEVSAHGRCPFVDCRLYLVLVICCARYMVLIMILFFHIFVSFSFQLVDVVDCIEHRHV